MIGFPYRDGYVVGVPIQDIRFLQPYLKYTDYTFGKLADNSLVYEEGRVFDYLRMFDLIFRSVMGDRLPRYHSLAGMLEERGDQFYYRVGGLIGDRVHSAYLVFSGSLCEKFEREIPHTLRANLVTLDKRLPEREESAEGLDTTVVFLQGIAIKATFATPSSEWPGLEATLRGYDWSTIAPSIFPSIPDLSGWNTRTDELLRRIGMARKLSPTRLSQIVELRGTR